ncbi:hypothetical protein PM082_013834 [Marasmius tenuissimus]|nr:hypothetical protein PM082_013834 [Marasmius tenuissimus]
MFALEWSDHGLVLFDLVSCLFWVKYFQVITGTVELLVGEFILILRLWAIYKRKHIVLWPLLLLWAACGAASVTVLVMQSDGARGSNVPFPGINVCILTAKLNILWAYWVPFVVFEVVAFCLSAYKTFVHYQASQEYKLAGFRSVSLLMVMFRDSTFYFIIMLAVVLTNALVFRFGTPGLYDIAHGPTSAIISIMLSHMILNLRKTARVSGRAEVQGTELSSFQVQRPTFSSHATTGGQNVTS